PEARPPPPSPALPAGRLRDGASRPQPGFPAAPDEDLLRLSNPPWYTACPNPFLAEFARAGRGPGPDDYHRDPLAVDVSEGRNDPLFNAHAYHTKVPHRAIVRAILHYTEPGDLVLDPFCGSGMTGVAAQHCGLPAPASRRQVEEERSLLGLPPPRWGPRRAILNDLGPAATFIAAGFNLPFDRAAFEREAGRILAEVQGELGWMYRTAH